MLTLIATIGLAYVYASCRLIRKSVDYSRHTSQLRKIAKLHFFLLPNSLRELTKLFFGPHEHDRAFP